MSSNELPVEQARKVLGDLVASAQLAGVSTVITRYGRPAAMLVPIPQESAMILNAADPRLLIDGVFPGGSPAAAQSEFDSAAQRYRIYAVGTKTLGYVYLKSVRGDNGSIRSEYRATTRDEVELGAAANLTDAAALVVAAACAPQEITTYERTTDEGTDTIVITVEGDEVRRVFLTDGTQTGEDHSTADQLHDYLVDIQADGYREA